MSINGLTDVLEIVRTSTSKAEACRRIAEYESDHAPLLARLRAWLRSPR